MIPDAARAEALRDCCKKPDDCKWGGPGPCDAWRLAARPVQAEPPRRYGYKHPLVGQTIPVQAEACEHCGQPLTCNAEFQEEVAGYHQMLDENINERDAALADAAALRAQVAALTREPIYDCATCGLAIKLITLGRKVIACPDCKTYTAERRRPGGEREGTG